MHQRDTSDVDFERLLVLLLTLLCHCCVCNTSVVFDSITGKMEACVRGEFVLCFPSRLTVTPQKFNFLCAWSPVSFTVLVDVYTGRPVTAQKH